MTPLQRDILTVLRINPVPLMTAEDIACAINEWPGTQRTAGGIGASCAGLRMTSACAGLPQLECKHIWSGRKWVFYPYYDGYKWEMRPAKKTFWFLRSRTDEAHLGLKHGHQRYLGCPQKFVWPLTTVTRAEFEERYSPCPRKYSWTRSQMTKEQFDKEYRSDGKT